MDEVKEETREDMFNRLLELEKRSNSVQAMKKSMMKDYNDQIKDIKSEIKEVVEELGEGV
jgi:predicted transcriptional regulator|tara:strand:- start:964 stop:1143 length:180 start_codon:yes stop_codon:yes gene_type:complete